MENWRDYSFQISSIRAEEVFWVGNHTVRAIGITTEVQHRAIKEIRATNVDINFSLRQP